MKNKLVLLLVVFIYFKVEGQPLNIYQQDFKQLIKFVKNSYPISDLLNECLKPMEHSYLNDLSHCKGVDEFRVTAQKYMGLLADGHSKIHCYNAFTRKGYYPVRFRFINDNLFIENYHESVPDKYLKQHVVSINHVSVSEIEERARPFISADNDYGLRNYLTYLLRLPTFYEYIGIDTDTELMLELENGKTITWQRDTVNISMQVSDGADMYPVNVEKMKYHKLKPDKLSGWSNKLFDYELFDDEKTCYFKFQECFDIQWLNANPEAFKPFPKWLIKVFWYFRGGNFSTFCHHMFRKMEKRDIENLVIDLRQNKGGTSILAYQLMDYLTDVENIKDYKDQLVVSNLLKQNHEAYFWEMVEKEHIDTAQLPVKIIQDNKNAIAEVLRDESSPYFQKKPDLRFKGNVYVLVGNETFSSAAMVAVLLADNNLATIVGNPIGIGASHKGEVLKFTLTNTGTTGSLSCKKFVRPNTLLRSDELKIDWPTGDYFEGNYFGSDEELFYLLEKL